MDDDIDGDMDDRFIVGIYNYCDRWCERCRFTDRCFLFAQEQEMLARHVLRGEDIHDPQVMMADVGASLQQAFEMLGRMAEEMGVDLNNLPPVEHRHRGLKDDPLAQRALDWSERFPALLKRVRTELPEIGEEMARSLASDPAIDEEKAFEAATEALEGLRDAWEVLAQYRFLIPVKIARAVGSLAEAQEEPNPELAQHDLYDANGTAKLVHECLGKAIAALWRIGEFHRPWLDDALPLVTEAEALRQAVDERFPSHRDFRRPGLDDEVEPA